MFLTVSNFSISHLSDSLNYTSYHKLLFVWFHASFRSHCTSQLDYCLNVTCVQCENSKSISTIDSAQPTMAHDADTDCCTSTRRQASIGAARYSCYATAECHEQAQRQPCCGAHGSQWLGVRPPECWRSIHLDDGRDTLRASRHCMCDLHMHTNRYDRAEVVSTLFRSIRFQSHAVESQIRKANKRDSNFCCCIQLWTQPTCVAASPRYPDLTACSSVNQDR